MREVLRRDRDLTNDQCGKTIVRGTMDEGINNVIYMELHLGPKMVNSTCGKTIVAGTIDRGSTVNKFHYLPSVRHSFERDKWTPVTRACILRLQGEERPPVWSVAANILNKQSQTADRGWSSSLGVGRGADISSSLKLTLLQTVHMQSLGPGPILWCDLSNEIVT